MVGGDSERLRMLVEDDISIVGLLRTPWRAWGRVAAIPAPPAAARSFGRPLAASGVPQNQLFHKMLLSLLHLVMRDTGEPKGLLELRAAAGGEGMVATRHQARQADQGVRRLPHNTCRMIYHP